MTQLSRSALKGFFETGDIPSQDQFGSLIDSFINITDDQITIAMVQGLATALAGKATPTDIQNLIGDITTLTSVPSGSRTNIVAVLQYILAQGTGGSTNPTAFTVTSNKTEIAQGTVIAAGALDWTVIKAMLAPYAHASYTAPSASLAGAPAPAVDEVGTELTIAFNIGFTQNDAGAKTSGVVNKNGAALTPVAGNYGDTITLSTTAIVYQAIVGFAQGAIKNDSNGNPDATGQIMAGSVNSNPLSYVGVYPYFYGANGTNSTAFNVYTTGTKVVANGGGILNIPFGASAQFPWFAIDADLVDKVSWYVNALNNGAIGGGTNLFASPVDVTVNGTGWTKTYKLFMANYATNLPSATIS